MTPTAPGIRPTYDATPEQESFALDMASDFDSVEFRLLDDGIAACIGRDEDGTCRIAHVDPDGNELAMLDRLARDEVRLRDMRERVARLFDGGTADRTLLEDMKLIAAGYLAAFPQYDGKLDDWLLAVGTEQMRTKGGVSHHPGDFILVHPRGDGSALVAFGFRRGCFVLTPSHTLRVVLDGQRPAS